MSRAIQLEAVFQLSEGMNMNTDTDLHNTDYVLNFGVVAIATQSPRASVKFCLKNIQTNKQKCWTLILTGETILALEANLRASMAVHLGTF